MIVRAVISHFGSDPYRRAAFELVRGWVEELDGWTVVRARATVTGAPAADRSRARNHWLSGRGGADNTDVLVFLDGDSLIPHEQLEVAAELAFTRPGMVFAYDLYTRLSREQTAALTSTNLASAFELEPEWTLPNAGSTGAVAITPACFDEVGGYDEAYVHGREDHDFAYRCSLLWPIRRVPGPLVHLWHPRPAVEPEAWPADNERYDAVTAEHGWAHLTAGAR